MAGPTLDVDLHYEESEGDEDPLEPWGRLFPLNNGFMAQGRARAGLERTQSEMMFSGAALVKDEYTFGRGEECDYCFETRNDGIKTPHFMTLSNTHFKIYREKMSSSDRDYVVFVKDLSSNGTFINGEKIGKNKQHVLSSDDEIALSFKKNKAFIFSDCGSSSNGLSLPDEFREKYTLSKVLGKGACGEVKMAFEKETCNKFAVKIIKKKTFSVGPFLGRASLEEAKILKSIYHPCIIRIEEVYDTPMTLYIVLELVEGGELFNRVVESGKFSEATSKLLFYQLVVAIKYLHDRGITHRDIKPENILLASDREETLIKVTDFGLSKFVGEDSLMKTLCGTPTYLAPEILDSAGTLGYSKAVDLWSMGVILYIMLAGYPPFSDEIKEYSLNNQIINGRYSFPEKYWEGISEDAIDMVKRLLTLDPKKRITVSEALEHVWLQDEDMLSMAKKLMDEVSVEFPVPTTPSAPSRKRVNDIELCSLCESTPPPAKQPATSYNTSSPNEKLENRCSSGNTTTNLSSSS